MKEMENKRLEQENTELKMESRIQRKFIVNLLFKITNLEEKIEYIEAENKIIYGDGSKYTTSGTISTKEKEK